ncbi:MAG: O-antigen ligase family protein [Acidobacteriaceae bacterium]|nr:O-antigen ligase family protein [Acidobacteriaceae bacterium]
MKRLPAGAMRYRKILLALASIPLLDCILNQLNNAFQLNVGPFSILQLFRGAIMVLFIVLCPWLLRRDPGGLSRVPLPAVAALVLLAVVISKELVQTGTIAMTGAIPYGQMIYWLLLWITVSLLCTQVEQAELLLKGLAVGTVLTALSVLVGYVHGGLNYYEDDSIRSSSGWFDTAKMITGVLVTGGVVILYLGRKKKGLTYPLVTLTCFAACVLTYARAGTVALGVVVLWLLIWYAIEGRKQGWFSLSRFIGLGLIAALATAMFVPAETLFARWGDIDEGDKAGSGRASFWKVAVTGYVDGKTSEQIIGRGYSSMSALLFDNYGADVKHTHNDGLDMLLVAGATGGIWLLFLIGDRVVRVSRLSLATPEGAASAAILLTYLCHAQFTGQLWGTDSMTYYMVSLESLYVIGRLHKAKVSLVYRSGSAIGAAIAA